MTATEMKCSCGTRWGAALPKLRRHCCDDDMAGAGITDEARVVAAP